ncbi:tRNA (adenosine(37)-N6)-threonylcarbamoyltransferase complex dimerization subunit type 1 TsaB [Mycolicibacterium sp. CH28]|uniref:tRNA (adenosine(37)-N6)-threonylcarbamoyltransferase complex dimerization subunit type 1 TsaB n=1 Tax=Mycolicibacterium sp. CH28 TaxID=2512237 RepID=UPI0010817863|nr:tRNA (adenosine(37)-N6)-threonylcarbamoyltransferase complex dimerization subunit type 1 TsaB [Mycolicibacterium sp. CH28]TGD86700.1 tRNA (adenosine(37)-N6)-threonylcarbamoyltransferase complex dimerization subunit type 1 TsaB [Mycolicibacterium sp. CH28]
MIRTVLVIDTATPAVTAAVVIRDGFGGVEVAAERITLDARAHAEMLTPNVVTAVAEAGLTMADLDAVVVGCGPGPFTGLRVGMATAIAYGHALDRPVFGVCSLDGIGVLTTGEVLVVTDARRREVYWARYRDGVRVEGPDVDAPTAVPVATADAVAGSPEHVALFDLPAIEPRYPTAAGLVAAVSDWATEPAALVPLYLRRPDAKTLAERGLEGVGQ